MPTKVTITIEKDGRHYVNIGVTNIHKKDATVTILKSLSPERPTCDLWLHPGEEIVIEQDRPLIEYVNVT